jgi:hypothetical protein
MDDDRFRERVTPPLNVTVLKRTSPLLGVKPLLRVTPLRSPGPDVCTDAVQIYLNQLSFPLPIGSCCHAKDLVVVAKSQSPRKAQAFKSQTRTYVRCKNA